MLALTRSAIDAAEAVLESPAQADDEEGPAAMLISIKVPSTKLPYTMRLLLTMGEGALDEQTSKAMIDALQGALKSHTKGSATD